MEAETNRQIASIWSSAAESPLSEEDGAEIARNLAGFFAVLIDWRNQDLLLAGRRDGAAPTQ